MFMIGFDGGLLTASGTRETLCFHGVGTIEREVRGFFADRAGLPLPPLVGVMPFDRDGEVLLTRPDHVRQASAIEAQTLLRAARQAAPSAKPVRVTEVPPAPGYAAMVEDALRRIAAAEDGALGKVVLSRALRVDMDGVADPAAIAERLAQDGSVTLFLASLGSGRSIVGATPELLLSRSGTLIASHPLAGSSTRSLDPVQDRANAEALLVSDKDRREHMLVVEAVFDTLAPHCAQLSAPDGTGLRSTATLWHLGTRIEGVLKGEDAPSAAGLAALLHPTPAVGGHPRAEALDAIRAIEPHDRGYYAGAVGWVDAKGDGEWYVSLRCAQLSGSEVLLHAGAGIVAGSDPDAEVAETAAKFRAMLGALGLDEEGRLFENAA